MCNGKLKPGARIVIGVILIETLYAVLDVIYKLGLSDIDITQVTKIKKQKDQHWYYDACKKSRNNNFCNKDLDSLLTRKIFWCVMHELICVGCGPGDPELLTVKGVKAIQNADVIACPTAKEDKPSIALSVVESLLDKSRMPEIVNLVFPMVKDKDTLESTWEKNTKILANKVLEGKKVVYLTVGDPYLYSTWIYLHRELQTKYSSIKINVIPGIVSMFTFASKAGISLAEGA